MQNFMTQIYLSYRGLFLWLNWPAYLSNIVGRPFFFVIMFALLGRLIRDPEATQAYIIGMAAFSIPVMVLGGVIQVFYHERVIGTIAILYASPGNRAAIFFSRAALHVPNGLLTSGLSLLTGWCLLGLEIDRLNLPLMLPSLTLISVSCAAFGLFLGSLAVIVREWFYFLSGSQGLLIAVTGVVIPASSLPMALRLIGDVLPITHGLVALRGSFDGATFAAVGRNLAFEADVAVAFGLAGYAIFRWTEQRSKVSGALEGAV